MYFLAWISCFFSSCWDSLTIYIPQKVSYNGNNQYKNHQKSVLSCCVSRRIFHSQSKVAPIDELFVPSPSYTLAKRSNISSSFCPNSASSPVASLARPGRDIFISSRTQFFLLQFSSWNPVCYHHVSWTGGFARQIIHIAPRYSSEVTRIFPQQCHGFVGHGGMAWRAITTFFASR